MSRRAIPQPSANQTEINRAVKESIETLLGLRTGKIKPLATTASSAEIAAKVNEIIERLQG